MSIDKELQEDEFNWEEYDYSLNEEREGRDD